MLNREPINQKETVMHRNHLVPCVVMLGAAVLISVVWGVQLGTLALVAVMLLCPALMLLMMRSMATAGGHSVGAERPTSERQTHHEP
jgi:cytochrome c oxidase subunit IV